MRSPNEDRVIGSGGSTRREPAGRQKSARQSGPEFKHVRAGRGRDEVSTQQSGKRWTGVEHVGCCAFGLRKMKDTCSEDEAPVPFDDAQQ
jgi:hypothetical protein